MSNKLFDVAVKTGTYTDSQGQEKGRYENIGVVLQGDKGPYMLLKKTFNPAGVNSDRDTIMVSLFQPQQNNEQRQQQAAQQPSQNNQGAAPGFGNQGGFPDDNPWNS